MQEKLRKVYFLCDFFAYGLHLANVLSGECVNGFFERGEQNPFTQAASEGTIVSLNARA